MLSWASIGESPQMSLEAYTEAPVLCLDFTEENYLLKYFIWSKK